MGQRGTGMIIASRNSDRVDPAMAAAIGPLAHGNEPPARPHRVAHGRRGKKSPARSFGVARGWRGNEPPARSLEVAKGRLGPALRGVASGRLPASLSRPGLETLIPLALLALAATAFASRTRVELHTAGDQIAVQTTATLISTIAAALFFDRFWRHLRRRDLLLATGLAVNAASNLGASLLLTNDVALGGHAVAWVVLGGRLAAWGVIAAAALTPDRVIDRPSHTTTRTAVRWAAGLAAVAILAVLLSA